MLAVHVGIGLIIGYTIGRCYRRPRALSDEQLANLITIAHQAKGYNAEE